MACFSLISLDSENAVIILIAIIRAFLNIFFPLYISQRQMFSIIILVKTFTGLCKSVAE